MNDTWIKSFGKLQITDNAIRVSVSMDFIKYYKQFVDKQFRIFSDYPAHGGHITITQIKINKSFGFKSYKHLSGKIINFEYNPDIIVGGQSKGFMNFWMKVRSAEIDKLMKDLGIVQNLHVTVSNTKGGVRPYIWETPKINKDLKPN
jgi:hypothetical protein